MGTVFHFKNTSETVRQSQFKRCTKYPTLKQDTQQTRKSNRKHGEMNMLGSIKTVPVRTVFIAIADYKNGTL